MNQRERLTKMLLKQGMIKLLEEKKISRINVKELCSIAGINRSTFYLHYANSFELLEDIEVEIIENTREYLRKIEAADDGVTYILAFLTYIKENEELFRVMLLSNENMLFPQRLINEVLSNIDSHLQLSVPERIKPYTYAYLVNGCLAIIQEWIRENFAIPGIEIAQLIFSLADHSLVAFKSIKTK